MLPPVPSVALTALLQQCNLSWLVAYAADTQAIHNPYHNPIHCQHVAAYALEAHFASGPLSTLLEKFANAKRTIKPVVPPEGYRFSEAKIALVIAALMHDYDHLGGQQTTDADNIALALKGLEQVRGILVNRHGQAVYDHAVRLIQVTEFPFIHEPMTWTEKCIRDADMMCSFAEDGHLVIMDDLRKEVSLAQNREISYQEMYDGQVKFMSNVVFHTAYGQSMKAAYLEPQLAKMRAMIPSTQEV